MNSYIRTVREECVVIVNLVCIEIVDQNRKVCCMKQQTCTECSYNLTSLTSRRGYDQYDIVAQFDCDHIPATTYLTSCLPAFMDSSIGYVAAPSVNSLGSTSSWAARGRLHYEGIFHGAGQAAWFPGWMPVCIGSHYTVRTAHLKSVSHLNLCQIDCMLVALQLLMDRPRQT